MFRHFLADIISEYAFAFFVDWKMKISEFYRKVKDMFVANNIDVSDADALFDFFFEDNTLWRNFNKNEEIDKKTFYKINKIANKRIKTHEPIYSIIGYSPFYGRFFKTNKKVLKPRLDTEILLDEALKLTNKESNILDLCCGSGILGITINLEKGASVVCVDVSNHALKTTKQNAKQLNASVTTIKTDMFKNINGKFDIIVCNPPYIKTNDIKTLDREVKNFDPKLALDGGTDGLKFYRIICKNFKNYLTKNGTLLLEIGFDQKEKLLKLFKNFNVKVLKDFNNLDRVLIIK